MDRSGAAPNVRWVGVAVEWDSDTLLTAAHCLPAYDIRGMPLNCRSHPEAGSGTATDVAACNVEGVRGPLAKRACPGFRGSPVAYDPTDASSLDEIVLSSTVSGGEVVIAVLGGERSFAPGDSGTTVWHHETGWVMLLGRDRTTKEQLDCERSRALCDAIERGEGLVRGTVLCESMGWLK